MPAAAQATVFQTNTATPANDGPAAEATVEAPETVGDVVDELVDTGEGVILAWLAQQTLDVQTIVIVVVIAGAGVFIAVVGSNVVVTRRLALMVEKGIDQARERAKLTPSPWDDRFLDVVKVVSGVILQIQAQAVTPGADVTRDDVQADG